MHELTALRKARLVYQTLSNWPLVAADKTGLLRAVDYRTRSGLVRCRGRSPDVNEVVAVMSGYEYAIAEPLPDAAVVFDVGANIGSFSLWLLATSGAVDLRVTAFEPYPPNAELLRRNLACNGYPPPSWNPWHWRHRTG